MERRLSRRRFLGGMGAALAGMSLMGATGQARSRPNFLVIVTDDQPYYTVPDTASVASSIGDRGTNFSPNAYVSTPICGPARASLLTGKWSHNTGLVETTGAYQRLRDTGLESDTIATRLKRAGYKTYFGGKYTNGYDGQTVPPGWDAWFGMVEPLNGAASFRYRDGTRIRSFDRSVYNETDVLRLDAISFLRDQAGSSAPWFAYVCPHAPHEPYYPADRYAGGYATESLRDVPSVGEENLSDKPAWVRAEAPYTDTERKTDTHAYRGMLRELQEVDDMVKRLMGTLANTGQLDNTYVFYLTDNGYLLGEHGLRKKDVPYEEASRTPFIVRGPDVPRGSVSNVLVSHVDVPATLLDLAGQSWSDLDGRSLLPVFAAGGRRPAGWRDEVLVEDVKRGWYMLRTLRWVYVEWNNGERELYDMSTDRYQMRSLHADPGKAGLVDQLSARLKALKECSGRSCRTGETA